MVSARAQDIRAKVYAQCKEEELSLIQIKAKVKKVKPRTSLRAYIPGLENYKNEDILTMHSKVRDMISFWQRQHNCHIS